jgi:hypothetical protein
VLAILCRRRRRIADFGDNPLISSRSPAWRFRIEAKSAFLARAASVAIASSWCSSSSIAHCFAQDEG